MWGEETLVLILTNFFCIGQDVCTLINIQILMSIGWGILVCLEVNFFAFLIDLYHFPYNTFALYNASV